MTTNGKPDRGKVEMNSEECKGCGLCREKCPKNCLNWSLNIGVYGNLTVEPDLEECISCGICASVCPDCAIAIVKKKQA